MSAVQQAAVINTVESGTRKSAVQLWTSAAAGNERSTLKDVRSMAGLREIRSHFGLPDALYLGIKRPGIHAQQFGGLGTAVSGFLGCHQQSLRPFLNQIRA
jgi:hypothetical protein